MHILSPTREKFSKGNSPYRNLTCTFFFSCSGRKRNVHAPGICHWGHANCPGWQLFRQPQNEILEMKGFFKKKSLSVRKGKASLKTQYKALLFAHHKNPISWSLLVDREGNIVLTKIQLLTRYFIWLTSPPGLANTAVWTWSNVNIR